MSNMYFIIALFIVAVALLLASAMHFATALFAIAIAVVIVRAAESTTGQGYTANTEYFNVRTSGALGLSAKNHFAVWAPAPAPIFHALQVNTI